MFFSCFVFEAVMEINEWIHREPAVWGLSHCTTTLSSLDCEHTPYAWHMISVSEVKIWYPCDIMFKHKPLRYYLTEPPHLCMYILLSLSLSYSVCTVSKKMLAFLHPRYVSCSQRGLQSPVHCGTRERGCVLLSPWASPGLKQQDVWGCGLLQPSPEVQPGVWAVQDHSEVLLLSRMEARCRRRHLSQHR